MSSFNVSVTFNGVDAEDPTQAVQRFQELLGIVLPVGCVVDVMDDETGEETEVEV